jgi:3-methylcrotonyl-CoA carboxylase alpha subunit
MPGKIVQVFVKAGDRVTRGMPLAVLEAMKMEHTLAAPDDARIEAVDVAQGDQVGEGAVVIRFTKPEKTKAA